jgi:hypothetical protein
MLREKLLSEINSYDSIEPNVKMFIDQSSIFWLSDSGHYVHIADHKGLDDDYIDRDHLIVDAPKAVSNEGVGPQGVVWMNQDFNSPFRISDFTQKIATINA